MTFDLPEQFPTLQLEMRFFDMKGIVVKHRSLCIILAALLLSACDEGVPPTPSNTPTLEATQQAIAISTAIQQQFTITAEAAQRYAPTQTIDAAVRQTAQVNNTLTAEYLFVITEDAYRAITGTAISKTATQDARNSDPTHIKQTVDAQVRDRFTATARARLQYDIYETVDAAVRLTATAAAP
jgi:hypothetical protein